MGSRSMSIKSNGASRVRRRFGGAAKQDPLFDDARIARAIDDAVSTALKQAAEDNADGEIYAGVVSADGIFYPSADPHVRPTFQPPDIAAQFAFKSIGGVTEAGPSHQIKETDQDTFANIDGVVHPPWDFGLLKNLHVTNVVHAAAIDTKASDYAYSGWELELRADVAEALADKKIKEDVLREGEETVRRFLETCFDGLPVEDGVRDFAIDYEHLGIGGMEIIRNATGGMHSLRGIPFNTVRILNDATKASKNATYLQIRYKKKILFQNFMDKVKFAKDDFDPMRAPWEEFPHSAEERKSFIAFNEDMFTDFETGQSVKDASKAANELFVLARRPFTLSDVYGTPGGIQAMGSMLAMKKIEEYNLAFFAAKGVPQYAIVLKGLKKPPVQISGKDKTAQNAPSSVAQLQEAIREFFTNKLVAGDRSVLILSSYGDAEIEFQKLSSENVEASFAEYESRMREMIRLSHHIPPAALGIIETANLGGGRDTSQIRRYRDHIVRPGQRQLANIVNIMLRAGLLIPYFNFKFTPIDVDEEATLWDVAHKAFLAGGTSANEYRNALPFELVDIDEEVGGDELHIRSGLTTVLNQTSEGVQASFEKALALEHRKLRSARDVIAEIVSDEEEGEEEEIL